MRLMERVQGRIRFKQLCLRTEGTRMELIRRFIRFHNKRYPDQMDATEVEYIKISEKLDGKEVYQ